MIDFENAVYQKLKMENNATRLVEDFIMYEEDTIGAYSGKDACVIFTDKRLLIASSSGIMGKKLSVDIILYKKIDIVSVSFANGAEQDSTLVINMLGKNITFEFSGKCNAKAIAKKMLEEIR